MSLLHGLLGLSVGGSTPAQIVKMIVTTAESHLTSGGSPRDFGVKGQPGLVKEFLLVLQQHFVAAGKQTQADAITALVECNAGQYLSPVFPSIDRQVFVFEMALRVRAPRLISQNRTKTTGWNICGPNSLMIDFAKHFPVEFAKYGVGLYDDGVGYFRSMTVKPSTVGNCEIPDALSPADFVLMGSLRDNINLLSMTGVFEQIANMTKPAQMCQWLTDAGYKNVHDHTLVELSSTQQLAEWALSPLNSGPMHQQRAAKPVLDLTHLNAFCAATQANNRSVFLLLDLALTGAIVTGQNTIPDTGGSFIPALHWVYVKRATITGSNIKAIVYTYGTVPNKSAPADFACADFLKHYYGYIEADPL